MKLWGVGLGVDGGLGWGVGRVVGRWLFLVVVLVCGVVLKEWKGKAVGLSGCCGKK